MSIETVETVENAEGSLSRGPSAADLADTEFYRFQDIYTTDLPSRLWYKEAVFYEVYVRAFCDGNGDGHGDIRGLTSHLDYLHSLGVNCLWLLPVYPSPLKDDGYDIANYIDIHPTYGTLQDFKNLVNAVHDRTMRIIVDFVPNHTSDQHRWFQEARKDRNSPYRDYYVWSDTNTKYKDARIIFLDTEVSNWTWDPVAGQYYWHRFFASQPDLNFENPKVCQEMLDVMRFWLDLGVDGFRCDAVPYLFEEEGSNCENLPRTHQYLKQMRKLTDEHYPGRVLLAEACQLPHQVREYFGDGDEFHMGFHFPVMPQIYHSMKKGESWPLKKIMEQTPEIPSNCQWVSFLRNHDELTLEMVDKDTRTYMWEKYAPNPRMKINLGIRRRLTPLLDNDRRKIELAHCLLFTLIGSPILYYGDEIQMGDNIWLPDRNGVRTPMQWAPPDHARNGGFSDAATEDLYSPLVSEDAYSCDKVNVRDAMNDPGSFFNILKSMIAFRRKHPCFGSGTFKWVDSDSIHIASYVRHLSLDKVLVVCNLGDTVVRCTLQIAQEEFDEEDRALEDVLTGLKYVIGTDHKLRLTMNPYQFLWLKVNVWDPEAVSFEDVKEFQQYFSDDENE
jgi:maltose alpha-D-glucosyltransferase/alpha-amylase